MTAGTLSRGSSVSVTTATPDQIKSVLLQDGWHDVSECEITQFAVGQGMSPPQPSKLYASINFKDGKSGKYITVPLRQVLAFENSDSYKSSQS